MASTTIDNPPTSIGTPSSRSPEDKEGTQPHMFREPIQPDEACIKRRLYSSEIVAMWNLTKIIRELATREQCVTFAEEQGLILVEKECRVHRKPMRLDYSTNKIVGAFVCHRGNCKQRGRISRSTGTWFENAKLDLRHIFYLMYCFALNWPYDKVVLEDILKFETQKCLSRVTIAEWYNYCREAVVSYQLQKQTNRGKIGGPGKIVQIDECKFGKRKFIKGQHVEDHWVLGLIENGTEDLRLEVCPDHLTGSAEVVVPLIKIHVEEGTTIHTNNWHAYDCLNRNGFIHNKINKNDPEIPTVTDDNTKPIESQWRVVKRFFNKFNYSQPENFADIVVEYLWRCDILRHKKDPFMEFIKVVKNVKHPK